jgi:hypothetical protein
MVMKYPDDFDKMSLQDDKQLLIKKIDIKHNDPVDVSARVKFDYPDAFFGIGILEATELSDKSLQY